MSKPIPAIREYMTATPHSIGGEQTLETASRMMRELHIRHLPVLHGGKLLGVLSDRDIKFIEAFRDVDIRKVLVEEAMSGDPYTVSPDARLDEVAATMSAEKYGSAIVVDNHHVVGIFTTVDACRALSELLGARLAN